MVLKKIGQGFRIGGAAYKGVFTGKGLSNATKLQKKFRKEELLIQSKKGKTLKERLQAENRLRYGDEAVNKQAKKNKDWKKMKEGKMTKEQFIKKYPNSGTARREKGKKWRPVHSKKTLKQLKNKNADFKKMRSGKMSKEAFIKKYPNSVTARESKKR